MTTIDHRILIPAGPEVVWTYVSDITHNPDWQIDCSEVIFLTSRREGPGLRWRYSTPGGHEFVIAVTAWYNGLGYEYYFVDGTSFRENKGRIRLQEIPEGTIVQWTFTYELGGVLGGMRNALGTSRQVDQTISESLKQLWQKLKQTGAGARPYEAKSLMREAPDVDARSTYTPRHPSPVGDNVIRSSQPMARPVPNLPPIEAEPPITEDDGQQISIFEPPVTEEDTRQRRAVAVVEDEISAVPDEIDAEPEFLDRMAEVDHSIFEPPRDPTDTQPGKPVAVPTAEPPAPVEPTPISAETSSIVPPRGEETEPLAYPPPRPVPDYRPARTEPERELEPEPAILATPVVKYRELVKDQPPAAPPEEAAPAAELGEAALKGAVIFEAAKSIAEREPAKDELPPVLPVAAAAAQEVDHKSIWEVFGVPRPSETGEATAVAPEPTLDTPALPVTPAPAVVPVPEAETAPPAAPEAPAVAAASAALPGALTFPPASTRAGLRVAMRRRMVSLRRP
jgi:hypothetical protein